MAKLISSVLFFLLYLQCSTCYDRSITFNKYNKCKQETVVTTGDRYVSSYKKFQKYVPLQSLQFGNNTRGEQRVKFYYQGYSHFGVALVANAYEPPTNEPIFYIRKIMFSVIQIHINILIHRAFLRT